MSSCTGTTLPRRLVYRTVLAFWLGATAWASAPGPLRAEEQGGPTGTLECGLDVSCPGIGIRPGIVSRVGPRFIRIFPGDDLTCDVTVSSMHLSEESRPLFERLVMEELQVAVLKGHAPYTTVIPPGKFGESATEVTFELSDVRFKRRAEYDAITYSARAERLESLVPGDYELRIWLPLAAGGEALPMERAASGREVRKRIWLQYGPFVNGLERSYLHEREFHRFLADGDRAGAGRFVEEWVLAEPKSLWARHWRYSLAAGQSEPGVEAAHLTDMLDLLKSGGSLEALELEAAGDDATDALEVFRERWETALRELQAKAPEGRIP